MTDKIAIKKLGDKYFVFDAKGKQVYVWAASAQLNQARCRAAKDQISYCGSIERHSSTVSSAEHILRPSTYFVTRRS